MRKSKADQLLAKCPVQSTTVSNEVECKENKRYSYRAARAYMFGDERFFLRKNEEGKYSVKDVYCGRTYFVDKIVSANGRSSTPAEKPFLIGPGQVPSQHRIINTEHTWPKSRFRYFESKYRSDNMPGYLWKVSDLHHLLPTDSNANSARANFYFGEVAGDEELSYCPGNKVGPPRTPEAWKLPDGFQIPGTVYQPPREIRGDIARGLFYFSVRYDVIIHPYELHYLKKWHLQDPVSPDEKMKHEGVYAVQNNRNPFIDYPFLVNHIEFTNCLTCKDPNAPTPPYEQGGSATNGGNNNNGENSTPPPTEQTNPAADQVGPLVANPCYGQSGKPFRKYAGFALMKTGTEGKFHILKFKQAEQKPLVDRNLWDSVKQFLDANGMTSQCGSGN
jgi:hypothetical protein